MEKSILSASLTRRSIRKFKEEKLSDALISEILKAGFSAPTAKNSQLWEFVVVDDFQIIQSFKAVHPHALPLLYSKLGILVCGDLKKEGIPGYWVGDCAAAIQNMLIRVEELGLGACWIGVYPNQDRMLALSELTQLPEHILPMGIIALGHPDEAREPSNRYDAQKVHFNKFGNHEKF